MKLQFHILLQISNYSFVNWKILHLKCYMESFYFNAFKTKENNITLTVPFEKSKTCFFVFSVMKNIVESSAIFKF